MTKVLTPNRKWRSWGFLKMGLLGDCTFLCKFLHTWRYSSYRNARAFFASFFVGTFITFFCSYCELFSSFFFAPFTLKFCKKEIWTFTQDLKGLIYALMLFNGLVQFVANANWLHRSISNSLAWSVCMLILPLLILKWLPIRHN